MSHVVARIVAIASLTQTSMSPSSLVARSAAASTCAASATSVGMASARPPSSRTSRAAASRASSLRATSATASPRLANSRAVARPMPADAPVMTVTMPERLPRMAAPRNALRRPEAFQPAALPVRRLERHAARRADRQDDRVVRGGDGLAGQRGVRDEDERPGGRVDRLAVDAEPRGAADDDVELLVAGRAALRGRLVVALDGLISGRGGDPGVDAEGADAEVVAQRLPVRLGVRPERERRNVVEVGRHVA